MTLTTPVQSDHSVVFPGENWFFYWKTSASLWRSKLEEAPYAGKIYVPINWAFHSETGDDYDFATARPETALSNILSIASALGREVVFLLPVTPVPYLANGGVPHLLARHIAYGPKKLPYAIVDSEDRINRLYSFFDPRVFQAYRKFLRALATYFENESINADLYALVAGTVESGNFHSFLLDESKIFYQSLARFTSLKEEEGKESATPKIFGKERETVYKQEFVSTIRNLYLDAVKEFFKSHYEGELNVSFLGATTRDFFDRIASQEKKSRYSREILHAGVADVVASSVLIPSKLKEGALLRALNEISFTALYNQFYTKVSGETRGLLPLIFFEIFEEARSDLHSFKEIGLFDYLDERFRWNYFHKRAFDFRFEEHDESGKIQIFHAREISAKNFTAILRSFLGGARVILNKSGLSSDLSKRLELFYYENSLKVEKVNYLTMIEHISLGNGTLVVFDGDSLATHPVEKRADFWRKLIDTFEIRHVVVPPTEGIDHYWRYRAPSHSELRYESIRRLSMYNYSSYKRKFKIPLPKNFLTLKVIDAVSSQVTTRPEIIDVEMLPNGSFSVELGVYGQ